ncbi:DUF1190 domain-containing protein [Marinobacter confluentis]|uniref:DUF1190 domain-containing protein n=1 Tax=Marinobacter confluentis TaxID=1697557 RepID=A0A4Z1BRX2_9GAMM|nr:DUF1190 domain-containing protein [Marinobacter confluentis]TGN39949.1 DUF1190 domain-containing protein [Marinobacter confluentis]
MATQDGIQHDLPHHNLPRRTRRQKRTQAATLVLMGATPFAVLGLDPLHTSVRVFQDVRACHSALSSSLAYCEALSTEAESRHADMAPEYTSLAQCSADFDHVTGDLACADGWCSADNLSTCETTDNGHFRPPFKSFLVDESVLRSAYQGDFPAPESLGEKQLQPVYGIADSTLHDGGESGSSSYSHHSHIPFFWHYVAANGQYLGNQTMRGSVTMARSQLASSGNKTYTGTTQRGGFGATARKTMQSARS